MNIPNYIDVSGKHPIENITWWLQESYLESGKAVYLAYDANLYPCPMYSVWKETEFKSRQKDAVLEMLKEYEGEIYLDDVRIRGVKK